jgi:hypothetical protein
MVDLCGCGSGRDEEPSGENVLRLIQIRFSDVEFGENLARLSREFANPRFNFHAFYQLLIRAHNATLSVVLSASTIHIVRPILRSVIVE